MLWHKKDADGSRETEQKQLISGPENQNNKLKDATKFHRVEGRAAQYKETIGDKVVECLSKDITCNK